MPGAAGLALLGPIDEKFVEVTDLYAPLEDGTKDKAFISRGAQSDPRNLAVPISRSNLKIYELTSTAFLLLAS